MATGTDTLFQVRFPVTVTVVVTLVVLGLTGTYWVIEQDFSETFVFFSAATASGGIVLTAFYTAKLLKLSLDQIVMQRAKEDALDRRGLKERALDFGARWNDPKMHYARDACKNVYDQRGKPAQAVIDFCESGGNKTNIVMLLNFLEEIAQAKNHQVADPDILRDQFSGIITSVYQILGPWVSKTRTDRGRPKIWKPLEDLASEWH